MRSPNRSPVRLWLQAGSVVRLRDAECARARLCSGLSCGTSWTSLFDICSTSATVSVAGSTRGREGGAQLFVVAESVSQPELDVVGLHLGVDDKRMLLICPTCAASGSIIARPISWTTRGGVCSTVCLEDVSPTVNNSGKYLVHELISLCQR